MTVYYRTIEHGIIEELLWRVAECDNNEMIFVVDIGGSRVYKNDFSSSCDDLGRYVVVGVHPLEAKEIKSNPDDFFFEVEALGSSINQTGLGLVQTSTGRRIWNVLWLPGCVIEDGDIESAMIRLDLAGVEYRIVKSR